MLGRLVELYNLHNIKFRRMRDGVVEAHRLSSGPDVRSLLLMISTLTAKKYEMSISRVKQMRKQNEIQNQLHGFKVDPCIRKLIFGQ